MELTVKETTDYFENYLRRLGIEIKSRVKFVNTHHKKKDKPKSDRKRIELLGLDEELIRVMDVVDNLKKEERSLIIKTKIVKSRL
jgi:hypothetical protein